MFLIQIKRPDAFFQSEEGLVYLSAVNSRLPVVVDCVGAAFGAGQVDEAHFALEFGIAAVFQLELEDGMGAGTVGIGAGCAGGAGFKSLSDYVHDVLYIVHIKLSESDNIHALLGVFTGGQK